MTPKIVAPIAAALLLVAGTQTASSQKSKGSNKPSSAHVAISLGDGQTIESKSGKSSNKGGTNIKPWTTTHGSSRRRP